MTSKRKINSSQIFRRLILPAIFLCIIYFFGVIGFMFFENLSFLEALYMTTITITTVGFGLIKPLSKNGTIFVIFLVLIGTGTAAYIIINLIDYILSQFFMGRMEKRRIEKMINKLENHYIICGVGSVGTEIAYELEKSKKDFIVIDEDPEAIELSKEHNWLSIEGDATLDENLEKAGILRAKALFAALDTDSENVYVTLSAKSLNPNIYVVARATLFETISKLEKAGANKVVSPQIIGGRRMAELAIQPNLSDFLDMVIRDGNMIYKLVEVEIMPKSLLEGISIKELNDKLNIESIVISIIEKGDKKIFKRPSKNHKLEEGQKLIILGSEDEIEKITQAASNQISS